VVSRSKNKVSLDPPFKVKRSRMQGKPVTKVIYEPGAIKVKKEKEEPPDEDGSGYQRVRVYDSWEC
jgi:hypothetical protein